MIYKKQFEQIRSMLCDRLQDYKKELAALPDGELYYRLVDGRPYFFNRYPGKGNAKKERRIGITNNTDMIAKLVRKKYLRKAIKILGHDAILIDRILREYKPFDENTIMEKFIHDCPSQANYIYTNRIDEWKSKYSLPEAFYEQDLKSIASDGTRMRSGAEMYISARLDHYGIPYIYEAKIGIPGLKYIPDFIIMRPRDGKIFYWEHFGNVNDIRIMLHNLEKLREYAKHGIVPWDNLIITYGNKQGGFDGRMIDAMIELRLL